MTTVFQDS